MYASSIRCLGSRFSIEAICVITLCLRSLRQRRGHMTRACKIKYFIAEIQELRHFFTPPPLPHFPTATRLCRGGYSHIPQSVERLCSAPIHDDEKRIVPPCRAQDALYRYIPTVVNQSYFFGNEFKECLAVFGRSVGRLLTVVPLKILHAYGLKHILVEVVREEGCESFRSVLRS